ncbi:MAG TPA: hypothetical protein ENJ56_09355 [Anaerolineae bacterium]|nr:hypothetical protein [Anaerolineae bacterium]
MRRILFTLILFLFLTGCTQQKSRPLKPVRVLPQPATGVVLNEVTETTFAQLASTPDAFVDRLIRVTGAYLPFSAPISCPNNQLPKGIVPQWGMIADELQMNAIGFERIVPLLAEGETLVVDGVWHKYVGPVGCGKEPQEKQVVYYLEVVQILQPNPIVAFSGEDAVSEVLVEDVVAPDAGVEDGNVSAEPPLTPPSTAPIQPTATRDLTPPTPTPATKSAIPPQPTRAVATTTPDRATPRPTTPPDKPEVTPVATRTPLPTSVPRQTANATPPIQSATNTPNARVTKTPSPTPAETASPDPDAPTATPSATIDPAVPTATATPSPTTDPEATVTPTIDPDAPTATATPEGGVGTSAPTPGTPLPPTTTPDSYPPTIDPYS